MSELHQIDRPNGKYKKIVDLERFLVFCILDTACTYKMVCNTFDYLERFDMTTRKGIKNATEDKIRGVLQVAGYRFPSQHAKRIKAFGDNEIDLRKTSREELVKNVKGIGMKLASFFLRNTRDIEYAVLDVHTLRWLRANHNFSDKIWKRMTYQDKETFFRLDAERLGKGVMELDLEIWNKYRVGQ